MNEEALVTRIAEPLYRAKGWMKLAGVLSIIQGVFTIFSIWGIIICWIPIWMGVVLCSASNHIRTAFETNSDDEFRTSLEKLGTYFRVFGILAIVMLTLMLIGFLAAILVPAFLAARQAAMGQ